MSEESKDPQTTEELIETLLDYSFDLQEMGEELNELLHKLKASLIPPKKQGAVI